MPNMKVISCMKLRSELRRKSGITRYSESAENVEILAMCW